jgi:hypothetical protein
MIRIATLVTALLVASAASASLRMEPPARFNRPPSVPVKVIEVRASAIKNICTGWGRNPSPWPGGAVGACAMLLPNVCYVIWPRGQARKGLLWRHERSHCAGWPANHPR